MTLMLIQQVRTEGVELVHLEVRPSNRGALSLYGSLGFMETGCRSQYYTEPSEDAVLMSLKL